MSSDLAMQMAGELLDAMQTGEAQVDKELIEMAENILRAHQVYVQLLYVGMVVDRITQLPNYFETLDEVVEQVDVEDLAEASTAEKIRSISALNQAIKTKVEVINNMMASKEAVGMLAASMKDTFGEGQPGVLEESGLSVGLLEKIRTLPADQRQRVLGTAVNAIRRSMTGEDDEADVGTG